MSRFRANLSDFYFIDNKLIKRRFRPMSHAKFLTVVKMNYMERTPATRDTPASGSLRNGAQQVEDQLQAAALLLPDPEIDEFVRAGTSVSCS
jgi:hypothetical protein